MKGKEGVGVMSQKPPGNLETKVRSVIGGACLPCVTKRGKNSGGVVIKKVRPDKDGKKKKRRQRERGSNKE